MPWIAGHVEVLVFCPWQNFRPGSPDNRVMRTASGSRLGNNDSSSTKTKGGLRRCNKQVGGEKESAFD